MILTQWKFRLTKSPPRIFHSVLLFIGTFPLSLMKKVSSDPDILTTIDETGSGAGDIADDAKFFQDAATEYQLAYQSLDKKYSEQAVLVHEASEALKASESHTKELQKELDALKKTVILTSK